MRPVASFKRLGETLARDLRLARRGASPGWFTRTMYRGRLESRLRWQPAPTEVRLRVNGSPVRVFLTAAHLGALTGVFLDDEYDIRAHLPFAPVTVLDLGSNVGMAVAYLNAMHPGAKFVCVEPDPRNRPLLERTLVANGIPAEVVPAAVSAERGTLRLRMGADPTCSALETSVMHGTLDQSVEVSVTTVPDVIARTGWDRIDLLKIDIEGTELDLLGRNNGWLEKVRALVLEVHPNTSPGEIDGFLRPFGFPPLVRTSAGAEPVYVTCRS